MSIKKSKCEVHKCFHIFSFSSYKGFVLENLTLIHYKDSNLYIQNTIKVNIFKLPYDCFYLKHLRI